jgi:hypothetical protein
VLSLELWGQVEEVEAVQGASRFGISGHTLVTASYMGAWMASGPIGQSVPVSPGERADRGVLTLIYALSPQTYLGTFLRQHQGRLSSFPLFRSLATSSRTLNCCSEQFAQQTLQRPQRRLVTAGIRER